MVVLYRRGQVQGGIPRHLKLDRQTGAPTGTAVLDDGERARVQELMQREVHRIFWGDVPFVPDQGGLRLGNAPLWFPGAADFEPRDTPAAPLDRLREVHDLDVDLRRWQRGIERKVDRLLTLAERPGARGQQTDQGPATKNSQHGPTVFEAKLTSAERLVIAVAGLLWSDQRFPEDATAASINRQLRNAWTSGRQFPDRKVVRGAFQKAGWNWPSRRAHSRN